MLHPLISTTLFPLGHVGSPFLDGKSISIQKGKTLFGKKINRNGWPWTEVPSLDCTEMHSPAPP